MYEINIRIAPNSNPNVIRAVMTWLADVDRDWWANVNEAPDGVENVLIGAEERPTHDGGPIFAPHPRLVTWITHYPESGGSHEIFIGRPANADTEGTEFDPEMVIPHDLVPFHYDECPTCGPFQEIKGYGSTVGSDPYQVTHLACGHHIICLGPNEPNIIINER